MRLVDADRIFENGIVICRNDEQAAFVAELMQKLSAAPTVPCEPIVRCRNCVYAEKAEDRGFRERFIRGTLHCTMGRGEDYAGGYSVVVEDGYCDEGERRN